MFTIASMLGKGKSLLGRHYSSMWSLHTSTPPTTNPPMIVLKSPKMGFSCSLLTVDRLWMYPSFERIMSFLSAYPHICVGDLHLSILLTSWLDRNKSWYVHYEFDETHTILFNLGQWSIRLVVGIKAPCLFWCPPTLLLMRIKNT